MTSGVDAAANQARHHRGADPEQPVHFRMKIAARLDLGQFVRLAIAANLYDTLMDEDIDASRILMRETALDPSATATRGPKSGASEPDNV
jgi:hypothetical protein